MTDTPSKWTLEEAEERLRKPGGSLTVELARMLEEYEPHLAPVDPDEALVKRVVQGCIMNKEPSKLALELAAKRLNARLNFPKLSYDIDSIAVIELALMIDKYEPHLLPPHPDEALMERVFAEWDADPDKNHWVLMRMTMKAVRELDVNKKEHTT